MLKYIIYYYHVSENDLKHSALQWNALDVNESVLYKTKIPGNKKYENWGIDLIASSILCFVTKSENFEEKKNLSSSK